MKILNGILGVAMVGALALTAVGCTTDTTIPQWIEQQTCIHEWDDGEVTKEATCEKEGEMTYVCEVCGKTKTEKIEKTAHNDVVRYEEAATCTENGKKLFECEDCNELHSEVVKALGHTDEDENGVCDVCSEVVEAPETPETEEEAE